MTTTTDRAPAFVAPESVDECDERIAWIKGEIDKISAQLIDPTRRDLYPDARTFHRWRARATRARGALRADVARLKSWKAAWDRTRQQQAVLEKAADRARAAQNIAAVAMVDEAKRARRSAAIAALPEPDAADLILRLYVALTRLYRISGQEPSAMDTENLERARAYLVGADIFEP